MNNHKGQPWPYHMSKNGLLAPCASNPCNLHPAGSDITATSQEEAYQKYQERQSDHDNGLSMDGLTSADYESLISAGSYEDMKKHEDEYKIRHYTNIPDFLARNVDEHGMYKTANGTLSDNLLTVREEMSSRPLDDDEQKSLLGLAQNKSYLDNALDDTDYNKMPAATEALNDLAQNPSTSEETLGKITTIAISRRNNENFSRQVYISDIANNRNLNYRDARRLYSAYPEECVRAQHFNADIINDALKDETTPDRIKAIAITNPRATVAAMQKAVRDGGNTFKVQAMLNPNGKYWNVAHKRRMTKAAEQEQKERDRFVQHIKERIGIGDNIL